MTTKSKLESKIQELEEELHSFKQQLNNYKEAPTIETAKVGDVLEDGCIVLQKENGMALLVAPESTDIAATWSKEFHKVFENLKEEGFNPSQFFIPTQEQLNLAYKTLPQHFANLNPYYWSSTEASGHTAYVLHFNLGCTINFSKLNMFYVRAFRCVTY